MDLHDQRHLMDAGDRNDIAQEVVGELVLDRRVDGIVERTSSSV